MYGLSILTTTSECDVLSILDNEINKTSAQMLCSDKKLMLYL